MMDIWDYADFSRASALVRWSASTRPGESSKEYRMSTAPEAMRPKYW
jgi:hypothetical protein